MWLFLLINPLLVSLFPFHRQFRRSFFENDGFFHGVSYFSQKGYGQEFTKKILFQMGKKFVSLELFSADLTSKFPIFGVS